MNITILTLGSRGDVEPYLALAVGLQRSGHRLTIAASAGHADFIRSYGVKAFELRMDADEFMARRRRPIETARIIDDYAAASEGADLILQTGIAWGGIEIAQAINAAVAFAYPFPTIPSSEFPAFLVRWRGSVGEAYNRWTQRMAQRVAWALFGRTLNMWRSQHGLPKLRSYSEMLNSAPAIGAPTLYPLSPSILSKPSEWPATEHVTGYWFLPAPADWKPSSELSNFLDSGPPPVFVGFGSMAAGRPEQRTREVVKALERSGQRGLIFTGGGRALARIDAPFSVMFIESAPFSDLFPRMAAVVHHGGAGTTATALRAGVPSIIMPVSFDQFAWAHIVERRGVGVNGGKMARLGAERLSRSISKAVNDKAMRQHAATMATRIARDDGIANAIGILERHVAKAKTA